MHHTASASVVTGMIVAESSGEERTAIVVAIYFLFYFVVYLPRGAVQ